MTIMSNSYEPTSATAGHAATAAPTGPWPKPWVTLAARVAETPNPSSLRASAGTGREGARDIEHHHRARVDEAVHRERDQTGSPACLSVRPDQIAGMLVARHRRDSADPRTASAVDHRMTRSVAFITHHHQAARTPP
jgi:hypothetical protein